MELFNRRYLTIIAFLFLMTSLLCGFAEGHFKIVVAILSIIAGCVCALIFFKLKKNLFRALFSLFICLAIGVSSISSYLVITRSQDEAKSLVGNSTVLIKIIQRSSEDSYDIRLLRVGDKEVNIRAELVDLEIDDVSFGDRLIFNAEIEYYENAQDRSELLVLSADGVDEFYIDRNENENYFSIDGITNLCYSLREGFSNYVDSVFGSYGGIVKGLLVNDKSDIDAKTNSNFRRSGTLHILAVSGMHITLLMGALELLLRALRVKKEIRIVVVFLFALMFLVLTAFVASAVRSVLMLFAVYLTYLISEENDPITSLFVSISIIILFSPYAIYDLGMWMSFLATLGILLVYPHFDAIMPYPNQKNVAVRYTLRALVWCAKTLMLTIVANFFLLPIMWLFFGELSLSMIPCNLILSPIVTVLMPLCALATVFGNIPILGTVLVFLTKRISDLMLGIVSYFADMRYGVVSLKFEFASILILAFTVIFTIMLVIKIKRKLLIFAPMLAFAILFTGCFSIFAFNSQPKIEYLKRGKMQMIYLNQGAECSMIDVGESRALSGFVVLNNMSKYATEIDNYFINYLDNGDIKALEYMSKNTVVRNVYISQSLKYEDNEVLKSLFKCAEKYNIKLHIYKDGESVEIYDGVTFSSTEQGTVQIKTAQSQIEFSKEILTCTYGEETCFIDATINGIFELPLKLTSD